MRTPRLPLFRHSEPLEQALFLIREQLKSRRFFNALRSLGLSDASGEVHLEALILHLMNIETGNDDAMTLLSDLLDDHANALMDADDSTQLDQAAVEIYGRLKGEK